MGEKINILYQELRDTTAGYLLYQKRDIADKIKKIIPQIQEFVLWFLEENRFGIEQELYEGMCKNLLSILEDISVALEQEDRVLLNDAVAYGMMDYLELFMEPKWEDKADDNV